MGLTVENVLERTQEEIFEAGGVSRPGWDVQSGSITDSATSLTLEGRHSNVPADGLLEWFDSSMEVAEVKSVSGTTVTLQTRGALGSDAASHTAGTKVIVDPPYPRYLLLNALKALVGQLYAYGIYQQAYTDTLTINTTAPVQLPSGAKDVESILYRNGSQWFPLDRNSYRLFPNYSGVNSAPAIQFLMGFHGAATRIVYQKDFAISTFALSTDLETTVGLPSTLTPHLPQGLAGHVLMGRDVPALESEHIRPDPQNPQPTGTRMSVGRALWQNFVSGPVYAERVRLLRSAPIQTVYEGAR